MMMKVSHEWLLAYVCSYNGQEDGRVGLYIAAEPLTRDKNYFEVEIIDAGAMGTVGQC